MKKCNYLIIKKQQRRLIMNNLTLFDQTLDKIFDDFFTKETFSSQLKLNLQENENEYLIDANVAGIDKKDISLNLTKNVLTIEVNKKEEKDSKNKVIHQEIFNSKASRSIKLGGDVDENSIEAKVNNGILRIKLLKVKTTQKNIKIN